MKNKALFVKNGNIKHVCNVQKTFHKIKLNDLYFLRQQSTCAIGLFATPSLSCTFASALILRLSFRFSHSSRVMTSGNLVRSRCEIDFCDGSTGRVCDGLVLAVFVCGVCVYVYPQMTWVFSGVYMNACVCGVCE